MFAAVLTTYPVPDIPAKAVISSSTNVVVMLTSALPLNETPPIVLAVSKVVAVSALPVKSPVTSPTTVPTMFVAESVLVEGL